MEGLSFRAWRGKQHITLAEILIVIGRFILPLKWTLHLEEVSSGEDSIPLESQIPGKQLSTFELLHLSTPWVQIVDGEIRGFDTNGKLILLLRAIRSDDWDVETTDNRILNIIKEVYPDAFAIPK